MKSLKRMAVTTGMLIVLQVTVSAQSLQFTYTTVTDDGPFSPNHVLAVWAEDDMGNFIKSLKVMGTEKNKNIQVNIIHPPFFMNDTVLY